MYYCYDDDNDDDDVHLAHEAAHVFDGPARAVTHEMWCATATTTSFWGVPGGSLPPKIATFVRCISGKSPRVYNIIHTRYIYKGASRWAAWAARRFARRLHAMSSALVVFAI